MSAIGKRFLFALIAGVALGGASAADRIHPFEAGSFRHIVASHAGKPFVAVVWALECDYCQPSFKALADEQRRRKLAVVTIATDRAADAEVASAIEKKLRATGLASETWAFGSAPSEQLRFAIDPKWRGEMPRSYWFDSQGNMVAQSGVITADTISKLADKSH
jgi:hypothetical protein